MTIESTATHRGRPRVRHLATLGVAALILTAGCSAKASVGVGSNEVSKSDVETQVATDLANQLHQPTPKITCPTGLEAKVGASIDCELVAQGDTTKYPVHVTVDSLDNGTAHFTAEVGQTPVGGTPSTSAP